MKEASCFNYPKFYLTHRNWRVELDYFDNSEQMADWKWPASPGTMLKLASGRGRRRSLVIARPQRVRRSCSVR
jgi:hypothetical protein